MRIFYWVTCCLIYSSCTYRMHDGRARIAFDNAHIPIEFKNYRVDGRTIHFAEVNIAKEPRPTLFFIHGSPASWHCYENYMRDTDLTRSYRIISIDRPGFGQSDFGEAATVSRQAVLVGSLVAKLQNGQPFFLVGHSLGGPLAVKIAAQQPGDVDGLVLLAAAVSPGDEDAEYWRRVLMPLSFAIPVALQTSNKEIWWFKDDVLSLPADLKNIKCRVHIFHGLADNLVRAGNGYYAATQLVQASKVTLTTFEHGHHDIPWTEFDSIKSALMSWR